MPAKDTTANFQYGTVTTAPAPALSGLSMVVSGSFPESGTFKAVVWPEGVRPLASNAEIIRVAKNTGGTFTISARGTQGSTARAIKVGDQVMVGITGGDFEELWAAVDTAQETAEANAGTGGGTSSGGLLLGAALNYQGVVENAYGASYLPTFLANYDAWTPETELKMDTTYTGAAAPKKANVTRFKEMYAKTPNKFVRFHALIWHNELGEWVRNWSDTSTKGKKEFRERMAEYGRLVLAAASTACGGKILQVDVLNEVCEAGGLRAAATTAGSKGEEEAGKSHYGRILGGSNTIARTNEVVQFYAEMFKVAREVLPSAKLVYNDYSIERQSQNEGSGKGVEALALLIAMQELEAPVDFVGFQCHDNTKFVPTQAELEGVWSKFEAHGVKCVITEFDLEIQEGEGKGTLAVQESETASLVACALAKASPMLVSWGFSDKHSWLGGSTLTTGPRPLPFNTNLEPKPMWTPLANARAASSPAGGSVTAEVERAKAAEQKLREEDAANARTIVSVQESLEAKIAALEEEVAVLQGKTTETAPVLNTIANQTGTEGSALTTISPSVKEGGAVTKWTAAGLPAGLAISASTGKITGTPTVHGSFAVTVTGSNGGGSSKASFTLTIAASTSITQITARLSADGTSIESVNVPPGTDHIVVARNATLEGGEAEYVTVQGTTAVVEGTAARPYLSMQAKNAAGEDNPGGSHYTEPRLKTTPKANTTMILGVCPLSSGFGDSITQSVVSSYGIGTVRDDYVWSETSAVTAAAKFWSEKGKVSQPIFDFHGEAKPGGSKTNAKTVDTWAKAIVGFGVKYIEYGNETNYQVTNNKANGEAYAEGVLEALEALKSGGTGVKLLVQGSDAGGISAGVGGAVTTEWIDGIFVKIPAIVSHANFGGWTIHPYPEGIANHADEWGVPMMERMVKRLGEKGDTTSPIFATEWGITSTASGSIGVPYAQAPPILEASDSRLRAAAKGRLVCFMVFQSHDQSPEGSSTAHEAYQGIVTSSGASKGAVSTFYKGFFVTG